MGTFPNLRSSGGPAGAFRNRRPPPGFGHPFPRPRAADILPPGTFGELRSANGKVIRQRTFSYGAAAGPSPTVPPSVPLSSRSGKTRLFTVHSHGSEATDYRAVAFKVGTDTAIVAVPLREAQDTLHRLVVVEVLVGAGVIAALVMLGWLVDPSFPELATSSGSAASPARSPAATSRAASPVLTPRPRSAGSDCR